jgi:putative ABC transport system permease protein
MNIEVASKGRDEDRVFLRDVMAALDGQPVAAAAIVPFGDESLHTGVRRLGEPNDADRPARFQPVSPNYFDVLGIPLRAGRTFDGAASSEVVINETLAQMLWPDGHAVGNHLAGPGGTAGARVVGVVADAYLAGLGRIEPTIFQPAQSLAYLLFDRSAVPVDQVRAIVAGIDRGATVEVRAVGDNIGESLRAATHGAAAAAGLGLLALVVTAVGIGGVFSFAVTERTREIGIRMALGASRGRVRRLLLHRTSRPIAAGLVVGLVLAVVAGHVLKSVLFGLTISDPLTYAAVALVVVSTAWIATVVPMRRALRVDPAVTLRHD